MKKINLLMLALCFVFVSCSSIHSTFVDPKDKGEKVFAGTTTNIDFVQAPPNGASYPYTVMGILDFIPSAVFDTLFLPYTLYDKYSD